MTIRSRSSSRVGLVRLMAVASVAALALCASVRADSLSERRDYVDRLEAICKPDVAATQRAVKNVKPDVRAERFPLAASKLAKAARIFGGTVAEISAVRRPGKDAAQLAKWFDYLRLQESYLAKSAAALREERLHSYERNSARFVNNGNKANDVVLAFGFNYCRFNFRRFN